MPSDSSYLFVNKTKSSRNLSRSESGESFRILSHVRNQQHRDAPGREPWKRFAGVLSTTDDDDRDTSGHVTSSAARTKAVIQKRRTPIPDVAASIPSSQYSTIKSNEAFYALTSGLNDPRSSLGSFHTSIGGLEVADCWHLIGNSVGTDISRITFCAESLEPPTTLARRNSYRHDDARTRRLKACVDNDLLLYSSIAHGSASLAWKVGNVDDDRSRYWLGRTLEVLRARLKDPTAPVSNDIVLSVFTLALTALWNAIPHLWSKDPHTVINSQFDTCVIHLRAMLALVERAGGWDKFDPYILEGMLLVDKYTALARLSRPLIAPTFDPGDEALRVASAQVPAEDAIPNMASGFAELQIEPELTAILQDVGQFYHAAAGIWKSAVSIKPHQESLLYRRFQALHYHLLLFEPKTWTSQLVRLTSLVVMCNITMYTAGGVYAGILLRHLQKAMMQFISDHEKMDLEVWLWCLCTGATARLSMKDKSWYVDRFLANVIKMRLPLEVSAIQRFMTKYLYIPSVQEPELQAVIDYYYQKEGERFWSESP